MTQVAFSPNVSSYSPCASLSSTLTSSRLSAVSAGLVAYGLYSGNYLSYLAAGIALVKPLVTWYSQPHFRMNSNPVPQDVNLAAAQLHQDMLHCGIQGENRGIALQRYEILVRQNPATMTAETKAFLQTIHAVLSRTDKAPTDKTFSYDLERLYLELCLQNGSASQEHIDLFDRLLAQPSAQRHAPLFNLLSRVIQKNSNETLAFDVRCLLLSVQKDGSSNAAILRYNELNAAFARAPATLLMRAEAKADLCRICALFTPTPAPSAAATFIPPQTQPDPLPTNFSLWVDENRYITAPAKECIKNAYAQALQTQNPRVSFWSAIDALVSARPQQISGKNAHYSKRQFDILHPPAVSTTVVPAFDAAAWTQRFQAARRTYGAPQQLLQALGQVTKHAAKHGYTVGNATVKLDSDLTLAMQQGTKYYAATQPLPSNPYAAPRARIEVLPSDTLDAAIALKNEGYNVAVINMANKHNPGGGFEGGAIAQEEDEFRRSNYYLSLYPSENPTLSQQMNGNYHIAEKGVVYTPYLQVFRTNQSSGFAFMPQPEAVSAIAVAAYDLNPGHGPNLSTIDRNSNTYLEGTKEKIRSFLRAALLQGHDAIVLSALGCGAFRNDPNVVAPLFKEVLKSDEFKGKFRKVVFAILNDHNGTNFQPFHQILHGVTV